MPANHTRRPVPRILDALQRKYEVEGGLSKPSKDASTRIAERKLLVFRWLQDDEDRAHANDVMVRQQAFRARREERQEQLRVQIIDIKRQQMETLRENEELHKQLAQVREENALLKKCNQSNITSTNNDFSFCLPWQ